VPTQSLNYDLQATSDKMFFSMTAPTNLENTLEDVFTDNATENHLQTADFDKRCESVIIVSQMKNS
jgi:hypothetical protein